jgi:hypothetical protein
MKIFASILLIITFIGCSEQSTTIEQISSNNKKIYTFPDITAINAEFPLSISNMNFQDTENRIQLDDEIISKIEQTIEDYYFNDCSADSNETYISVNDRYIETIRLQDSLQTIFLVLLRHTLGGINSKILFYDNSTKVFSDFTFNFNLHALYVIENKKLIPSNLKTLFNIETPEIEILDFEKDGINDYKFTRLYHNGTSNAIEIYILKVGNNKIDTLEFMQEWIGLD